jgi:hypothetical protein
MSGVALRPMSRIQENNLIKRRMHQSGYLYLGSRTGLNWFSAAERPCSDAAEQVQTERSNRRNKVNRFSGF